MGFMWEGSTGSRALAILKALPQGAVILTPDFARQLGVEARALHQLLANALKLRLVKKVRQRGVVCVGWKLGPGNISATIERRRAPAPGAPPRRRRPRGELPPAPPPPALFVHWEGVTAPRAPAPRVIADDVEPVQLPLLDYDLDDLWTSRRGGRSASKVRRRAAATLAIVWLQLGLFDA
ncbi:MAG: hypothetical protein ACTHL8_10210 [Burkholderiaceae bacterium]